MSEPMPHPPDPDRVAGAYARNGDVELWYQHFVGGDGATPLLLINGLGSPSVAYQKGFVDELLAVGFDVVRFDNRDLGRSSRITASSPTEPGYRLADMARDAVAVLDAVGWDRAVVFGQSMGGMIAQQLAIDHPERLLALVSLMSSTGNRSVGHPSASAKAGLLSVPPNDRAGWLDHRVETERYWASPALWDPAWVRAKGEAMFDHGIDPKGTARQYRAVLASPMRDAELGAVRAPTLVLHGSADTLIDPSGGRHTAACVAGARYVEIDGMGHDLPPALWSRLAAEAATLIA
ncbi:MAG: alpha/beta hydrolase [Acidimicrobiales bacterium]